MFIKWKLGELLLRYQFGSKFEPLRWYSSKPRSRTRTRGAETHQTETSLAFASKRAQRIFSQGHEAFFEKRSVVVGDAAIRIASNANETMSRSSILLIREFGGVVYAAWTSVQCVIRTVNSFTSCNDDGAKEEQTHNSTCLIYCWFSDKRRCGHTLSSRGRETPSLLRQRKLVKYALSPFTSTSEARVVWILHKSNILVPAHECSSSFHYFVNYFIIQDG